MAMVYQHDLLKVVNARLIRNVAAVQYSFNQCFIATRDTQKPQMQKHYATKETFHPPMNKVCKSQAAMKLTFCTVVLLTGSRKTSSLCNRLFSFCEFRTVSYSGSCGKQVVCFAQSMLVFVLPLRVDLLPNQSSVVMIISHVCGFDFVNIL